MVSGQIREMADTLVTSGMKDLGYNWIVLDECVAYLTPTTLFLTTGSPYVLHSCWHPSRDSNNTLVPFPRFFPDGMAPVIDYVHSKGLQFGLYTSVGDKTCHGGNLNMSCVAVNIPCVGWSPGSYGHYEQE